jgi:fructose-specific phosphotransferase system IIC component
MDRNPKAWVWELLKGIYAGVILLQTGDWFLLSKWIPGIVGIMVVYHVAAVIIGYWFSAKRDLVNQLEVSRS